jgi:hypothetical protein
MKQRTVRKVYVQGQSGYYLLTGSEAEVRKRARELRLPPIVKIEEYKPRPWRATDERTEVRAG